MQQEQKKGTNTIAFSSCVHYLLTNRYVSKVNEWKMTSKCHPCILEEQYSKVTKMSRQYFFPQLRSLVPTFKATAPWRKQPSTFTLLLVFGGWKLLSTWNFKAY